MHAALDYQTDRIVPAGRGGGLHVAAVVTLCFTFPLIFLGGLVTSHGAGMSVPDWPNSYGYNMFLFPPSRWTGGIFFEHTHRLLGTVVGFCATVMTLTAWGPARSAFGRKILLWVLIGLEALNLLGTVGMWLLPDFFRLPATARSAGAIFPQGAVTAVGILLTIGVAWFCRRREPRRWVRWTATASLGAVCFQGLLGGLRVDLVNLTLAIVHGCFAQLTFCLILLTAIVTGRWWKSVARNRSHPEDRNLHGTGRSTGETPVLLNPDARSRSPRRTYWGKPPVLFACLAVSVIYAQLIVGAVMRHNQAGLAIPDLPLAYGHWLPPVNSGQLAAANHERVWKLGLDPVTLPQVWIHFAHRMGAVAVSAVVLVLAGWILLNRRVPGLMVPAASLVVLLLAQVTLGLLTVYYRKPADVASAHVATGALLLATAVLTAVRAGRITYEIRRASAVGVSRELQPALI